MLDLRKVSKKLNIGRENADDNIEKNNRGEEDGINEINRKIIKHKKIIKIRIAAIVILAIIITGGIAVYRSTVKYTDYKTVDKINIDDGVGSKYVAFGEFFIKYGLDGISYIDGKETVWNQAYDMSNPIVDVCGDYAAVADKGTNTIYIFDKTGSKGQVSTSYPIIRIEVANQGVVAALLEENTANYIEVYDKNGDTLISHKTLLNGNGYPLAFTLSDDGTKMMVSYVSVSNGTMESKVLFYNFSEVGQNEVDRMVGGFNQYKSTVIPTVKFLNNNVAIAVGDDVLSIYKMREKPSLEKNIEIKDEIQKVFYDEEYIGLVFKEKNGVNKYRIEVYNLKGKEEMNQSIQMDFEKIKFSGKNIVLYNDMSCEIISFSGKERFNERFKETVVDIMPTKKFREYLVVTNNNVKKIKLK